MRYIRPLFYMILIAYTAFLFYTIYDTRKGTPVEIIVVDGFSHNDDHGRIVAQEAYRWSLWSCKVRKYHTTRKPENFAKVMAKVKGHIRKNDRKRYIVNFSIGSYRKALVKEELIKGIDLDNVVIVGASGNDGDSKKEKCLYPAAYDCVIAVAATDKSGKAPYSNYGDKIDIAVRTKLKRSVRQERKWTLMGDEVKTITTIEAGTSLSAPKLAGILALVWQSNPYASKEQVKSTLYKHCHEVEKISNFSGRLGHGELSELEFLYNSSSKAMHMITALVALTIFMIFLYFTSWREFIPSITFLLIAGILLFLFYMLTDIPQKILWGYFLVPLVFMIFLRISILLTGKLYGKRIHVDGLPEYFETGYAFGNRLKRRLSELGAQITMYKNNADCIVTFIEIGKCRISYRSLLLLGLCRTIDIVYLELDYLTKKIVSRLE